MDHVNLGASGLRVSRIAHGSWLTVAALESGAVDAVLGCCLDAGVNLFDTADVYDLGAAESVLGDWLAGQRRDHLVLATKVYFPMSDSPNDRGLSRKHVHESIDHSLRRLGTDYVDLYQCHRYDESTPLAETVRAMGDLIARGKVLYWGTSSWPAAKIREACELADALGVPRPISEQPRYNLLCREIEADVLPTGEALGIGFLYWSPLAQGYLTGKYRHGSPPPAESRGASANRVGTFLDEALASPEAFDRLTRLEEVAADFGLALPVLALAWCLRRTPSSCVIVGASRVEQMQQNLLAGSLTWPDGLDAALEAALAGEPLHL